MAGPEICGSSVWLQETSKKNKIEGNKFDILMIIVILVKITIISKINYKSSFKEFDIDFIHVFLCIMITKTI